MIINYNHEFFHTFIVVSKNPELITSPVFNLTKCETIPVCPSIVSLY